MGMDNLSSIVIASLLGVLFSPLLIYVLEFVWSQGENLQEMGITYMPGFGITLLFVPIIYISLCFAATYIIKSIFIDNLIS
jgi:hypothetical protein